MTLGWVSRGLEAVERIGKNWTSAHSSCFFGILDQTEFSSRYCIGFDRCNDNNGGSVEADSRIERLPESSVVLNVSVCVINVVHSVLVQALLRPDSRTEERLPGWRLSRYS